MHNIDARNIELSLLKNQLNLIAN